MRRQTKPKSLSHYSPFFSDEHFRDDPLITTVMPSFGQRALGRLSARFAFPFGIPEWNFNTGTSAELFTNFAIDTFRS
jgi:hypothetical protein